MKKSILALAVASAASLGSVAQADNTTLYGSVRMEYKYNTTASKVTTTSDLKKGTSNIGNAGSRFGIKGSDDLGNGLSAFYKYENRIPESGTGVKTSKLYVGLKGSFGSFSLGTQNIPHDWISNNSDPFNALTPQPVISGTIVPEKTVTEGGKTKTIKAAKFEAEGGLGWTSASNSIVYETPDMSGFKAGAALVVSSDKRKSQDNASHAQLYNIAAQYEANGIYAGLSYQSETQKNRKSVLGLGLGYKTDQFSVGFLYEHADQKYGTTSTFGRNTKVEADHYRLGGNYNISDMDSVYAGVAQTVARVRGDDNSSQKIKPVAASLGYQHKFSKRTRVWAEYGYKDNGARRNKNRASTVSIGLRTDF